MKSFRRKFSCFFAIIMLFQCFYSFIVYAAEVDTQPQVLNVQMYNGNRTENINSIFPWFKLKNCGTKSINLKDVKLRYYFTIDGEKPQNFWCDYSTIGSSNVTGTFIKMNTPCSKADYYLEVGFKDSSESLLPGSDIQVQTRFAKNDWSNYDQTNDYSFNATAKDYANSNNYTALINGNVVIGNEPVVPLSVKYHDKYLGIILEWNDNEDTKNSDITFGIKRKIDSGEYKTIVNKLNNFSYIDRNVEDGKTYTYIISATNKLGQSKDSKEIVVKHVIADTDKDGLPDDFEDIIGTDKTKPDTDGNGIIDSNEDSDKDGLTNLEEYKLGTDPLSQDSDKDGLYDGSEVKIYKTNPLEYDTDSDGLSDGAEIKFLTNPLVKDTNGNGILDGDEKFEQTVSQDIKPSKDNAFNIVKNVTIDFACTGDAIKNTTIKSAYGQDTMASNVVGRMGYPINLETSSKFDKATVKFQYDDTLLNATKEDDLGVLWHDIANDKFVYMPCTVDKTSKTVTFETTHFSNYILIDNKKWFDEWRKSINYRTSPDDTSYKYFDIVLTIDSSGSMNSSDCDNIRKTAAKQFVDTLLPDDKASVVKLDNYDDTKTLIHLTKDKVQVKNAIDKIDSRGGTCIYKALYESMNELTSPEAINDNNDKIMILLTDGLDNFNVDLNVQMANKNKIKIFTIGLGNGVDDTELKSLAVGTGGNYYQATKAADLLGTFQSISDDEAQQVDPTDTDKDGLPDELETRGMRLSNGQVVTTDPYNEDSDGDGLLDGEEIQNLMVNARPEGVPSDIDVPNYSYFKMRSNPKEKDTDGDGILDKDDNNPLMFDARIVVKTDTQVLFNTGDIWTIFGKGYYQYTFDTMTPVIYAKDNLIISINNCINFSSEELACLFYIDIGGVQAYISDNRENLNSTFYILTGVDVKYYQHTVDDNVNQTWKETDKTKGNFWDGRVISNAEALLTWDIFKGFDSVDFTVDMIEISNVGLLVLSGIDLIQYVDYAINNGCYSASSYDGYVLKYKDEAEAEANLTKYLSELEKKPQVVINKEVGTAFEYYVEGTKLTHVDYDIQDLYGIIDRSTGELVQVRPDFTLKSLTTGDKVAFADAKTALTGKIPYSAQFERLVWLTEQETTTKTLIYYVPSDGDYISQKMIDYAEQFGVRILQVVAK